MKVGYNRLRRFAAILVGLVFFVSGTLKLRDPVGASLIVKEYLNFFHIGFLGGASMGIGITFALLEAISGTALITGRYRKFFAILTSCLIAFFTLLTLILWIANPSFDCGCFGEAIHLTHAQSFLKNLVLLGLSALAFIPFKEYGQGREGKLVPFYLVSASLVGLLIYSYVNIPLKDFTPYNFNTRLLAAEILDPEGDNIDYVTVFIYEKNGEEGSFTEGQLPDSTWTFVRSETMLKEDHYRTENFPDLEFTDAEGNFCNELAAGEHVMVCSVPEPSKVKDGKWSEIAQFISNATENGFTPLLLVCAEPGSIASLIPGDMDAVSRYTIENSAYYSSFKTLISLNRSPVGITYFNEGDLVRKWHQGNMPSAEDLAWLRSNDTTELTISADTRGNLWFEAFFLYCIAVMVLL